MQALIHRRAYALLCHAPCDRQDLWFTALITKTSAVQAEEGGLSAVFGKLLDVFFDVTAHDVSSAGLSSV